MCFDLTLRNLGRSHCFYSLHRPFCGASQRMKRVKSHPKERNSCYTLVVFLKLSVEYPPSFLEGSILHLAGRLNRHSGNILNSHKIWNAQNIPFKMFLNTSIRTWKKIRISICIHWYFRQTFTVAFLMLISRLQCCCRNRWNKICATKFSSKVYFIIFFSFFHEP